MLRITQSESSDAAKQYFGQALSRGDYYVEGQEIAGSWSGKGAERLGLTGPVSREAFSHLLENRQPDGTRLTARTNRNRRPGYDFTFDVPKSVSMVHALTGDGRIVAAMQRALSDTLSEMEREMHARVRKSGAFEDRKTSNFICADFTHFTSRPTILTPKLEAQLLAANPWLARFKNEDGRLLLPDPHLHNHAFVINATYDEVEKEWKAGEFMRLKRDASYYQAAYHTRLAGELQKLGYMVERTANAFEIAGVPRSLVEIFSRRTKDIEEVAKALGITDAKEKDGLGAKTRHAKIPSLDMAQLRAIWRDFVKPSEAESLDAISGAAKTVVDARARDDATAARGSIHYALGHELERASVVSERRLMGRALQRAVGDATIEKVAAALRAAPDVLSAEVDGERDLTTRQVLEEEKLLMSFVREGRGQTAPLVRKEYHFRNALFANNSTESDEQRKAVLHVLKSPDWVLGVVGRAGTGKTTLLHEIDAGIKSIGKELVLVAPTAEAARGVLRGEGFGHAETIKRLLVDPAIQSKLRGNVLWVDEAGMVGNRDLLALLKLAKENGVARVVLAGDPSQIRSVPRGDAFRFLEKNAGLSVARLQKVRRQKTPHLKAAVEAISEGNPERGFFLLDQAKGIHEGTQEAMRASLARAYADKISEYDGDRRLKTALIVSPTHREGDAVTSVVREELRSRGKIGANDYDVLRTLNLSWTGAQKADSANYEPGLVIQFKQNARGFRRGERVRVLESDATAVRVRKNDGTEVGLPMKVPGRFEVYALRKLNVAAGDMLKVTENSSDKTRSHRYNNGDVVKVARFGSDGEIVLTDGRSLPKHFGHLTHAYVSTADAAQSKTVDSVFAAIGKESFGATDMRRVYVTVSRARDEVKMFTDDKAGLFEASRRDSPRRSATELAIRARRQRASESIHPETNISREPSVSHKIVIVGQSAPTRTITIERAPAPAIEQRPVTREPAREPVRVPRRGLEFER